MADVRLADVDAATAAEFLAYAAAHGAEHDDSYTGDDELARFDPALEPAVIALDSTGAVVGAASVMLDGYATEGTSRFRILHSLDPADCNALLERVVSRLPDGVARAFLFLPENAGQIEQTLASDGFAIARKSYILRHLDPKHIITPEFPSEVQLREATGGVAHEWANVVNSAFRGEPGRYDMTTERAAELLGRADILHGGTLLAYREGLPAGVVMTVSDSADECSAEIETLAVAPAAQGKGLGRALLSTAVRAVASQGCRSVSLSVSASNRRAMAMYLDLGFRADDVRVCWELRRG